MTDEPGSAKPAPAIRPLETVLAVGCFLLLCGNVASDVLSSDYDGGILSVALIGAILAIIGKNAGNLVGGGK